jgi:hypothetical protein
MQGIPASTALVTIALLLLAYLYYLKRRPRWREIIVAAVGYHRFHLNNIRRENGVSESSSDLAYSMLMVIDRQFMQDLKGSPGLLGIFRGFIGEKSTLASLNGIVEKIYRERAFTGYSDIDVRIERLFSTMVSMIYRYHMLTSVLGLPAVLYMDLMLVLSMAHVDTRGSSLLYRDLSRRE